MYLKELKEKILEALVSALPITAIVYLMVLTPLFDFSTVELVTFTVGAVLLVLGFRAIIDRRVKEHRAMKRILDADDQQIINFM